MAHGKFHRVWILLALTFLTIVAYGDDIHGHENPADFGNLNQHDLTGCNLACGPAAAVNSFVFLQKTYPGFYSDPLIDLNVSAAQLYQEEVTMGNMLCTMMQCMAPNGTAFNNFVSGKSTYLATKHNPITSVTTYINPTPQQLAAELSGKEDVEILMNFPDPGFKGHYVTLYDIDWDTLTESGTIHFIDPLDGKQHFATLVGNIVFYDEPDGTKHDGTITRAAAESPYTPEPPSVVLFATLFAVLAASTVTRSIAHVRD